MKTKKKTVRKIRGKELVRIPQESCGWNRWRVRVRHRNTERWTDRDRFVFFFYSGRRLCHLDVPICWVCDKLSKAKDQPLDATPRAESPHKFYWPTDSFREISTGTTVSDIPAIQLFTFETNKTNNSSKTEGDFSVSKVLYGAIQSIRSQVFELFENDRI